MPTYQAPGIYVEEVPSALAPIAGVSTSTAGFIGRVSSGVTMPAIPGKFEADGSTPQRYTVAEAGEAQLITSWHQFKTKFGDFSVGNKTLAHAVYGFFNNGGTRCWVIRLKDHGTGFDASGVFTFRKLAFDALTKAKAANSKVSEAVTATKNAESSSNEQNWQAAKTAWETAKTEWDEVNDITKADGTLKTEFDKLTDPPSITDAQTKVGTILTDIGNAVTKTQAVVNAFSGTPTSNQINEATTAAEAALTSSSDALSSLESLAKDALEFEMTQAFTPTSVGDALKKFEAIDEISIVAVPGVVNKAIQEKVLDHCETAMKGNRFAILDGQENVTGDLTVANITGSVRDSSYAALYYPWIQVYDPVLSQNAYMPPSGHIAGIYARVDSTRGVHKAPANEVIRGALGLERPLSRADQAGLNPKGVNVIRQFGSNLTVWGARTIGGDDNGAWKYINVRRLFIYLAESINQGTQWVVFEPNTPALWAKIRRNVTAFLTNVWRSGGLFGTTPQEAFYVRCDENTTPESVRQLGQVVIEVGVAIVRPAEFVIFRLSQWAGPAKGS